MAVSTGLRPYAFVLAGPDLRSSVVYFRDVLGFRPEWGNGTHWQALSRDGVRPMIGHCPDAPSPAELGDHGYFAYLHAEFVQRGPSSGNPGPTRPGACARWPLRHPMVIG